MNDSLIQQIRKEVTSLGVKELRTPEEVDTVIPNTQGTMLLFVNSACRCAAGVARPGLARALDHPVRPDHVVSVFAGLDIDATARARHYLGDKSSSSPSFALLRDGKLVKMIRRFRIERHTPNEIAKELIEVFEQYCSPVQK